MDSLSFKNYPEEIFSINLNKNKDISFNYNLNEISDFNDLYGTCGKLYNEENSYNYFEPNNFEDEKNIRNKMGKINQKMNSNFDINLDKNNTNSKIFKIYKIKKLGRIKKSSNKKGKHNRFQRDNIIIKFKVLLMNNIYNYINNSFNVNSYKYKKKLIILKRLSSANIKSISKKDNILWFNSKIKDIFSQKISTKIISCNLDYNEKLINKIYSEKKEIKVINILDRTIKEIWNVYINNDKNKEFIGLETIKNDINKFRNLGETEKYINEFINIANNYEIIFNKIVPRKEKKYKIK